MKKMISRAAPPKLHGDPDAMSTVEISLGESMPSSSSTVEINVAADPVDEESKEPMDEVKPVGTWVSRVTSAEEEVDIAPDISEAEMALLMADEKKSARKRTYEERGRRRKRGGQNLEYYTKWAGKREKQY